MTDEDPIATSPNKGDTSSGFGNSESCSPSSSSSSSSSSELHQLQHRQQPLFKIRQRVLARDTDTPLLYDATVRKMIYAPKSKKVYICRVNLDNHTGDTIEVESDDDTLEAIGEGDEAMHNPSTTHTWHYFVHYQGWNVNWDRWVEEENLFEDKDSTRLLAKKLKEESKCLKKKKSDKVVMEVMQRILKLEQEFREKEARGESVECLENESSSASDNIKKNKGGRVDTTQNQKRAGDEKTMKESNADIMSGKSKQAKQFIQRELHLRQKDLSSRKPSNAFNIPFTMKKVLTDEWEVISQCGMVHKLPACVSVKDALNAYYEGKVEMLRNDPSANTTSTSLSTSTLTATPTTLSEEKDQPEEKKDDSMQSSTQETTEQTNNKNDDLDKMVAQNPAEQEWKDMTDGLAMYFDKSLPKQLLYRQEVPQCIVQGALHPDKRYCELYPCEHLVRLCLKLPELVDQTNDFSDDEKAKIIFKLGDFIRFLQKHQGMYLLSRYRHPTTEEKLKAKKMESRLGLGGGDNHKESDHKEDENVLDDETNKKNSEEDEITDQCKRKRRDEGPARKTRRKNRA